MLGFFAKYFNLEDDSSGELTKTRDLTIDHFSNYRERIEIMLGITYFPIK